MIPESVAAPRDPKWPEELVALYSAERTGLVRAAFLICGTTAGAEDAVHDAVTRVAARWAQADDGRRYLYAAVVNAARDGARRETRAARLLNGRRDRDAREDVAALSAESSALRAALLRLPVNHRAAIVLRYFLDWDDDEIARHYDVRAATVRSWVHRGITRLQRDWET